MRDFWTKTVIDSRCTIVKGTFDDTGVEDGWADIIIIAQVSSIALIQAVVDVQTFVAIQAFHWCLDHGKALAEFARILKKDGAVVLLWNLDDRFAFVHSFTSIFLKPLAGMPQGGLHRSLTV
jgi:SAM-dependent methyltransferase